MKTLVYGVGLSVVRFGNPLKFTSILFQYVDGFIVGAAIHDDVLDVRVVLPEHTLNGGANKTPLVVRRGNYGHAGIAASFVILHCSGFFSTFPDALAAGRVFCRLIVPSQPTARAPFSQRVSL